jgi:hypothetical protein
MHRFATRLRPPLLVSLMVLTVAITGAAPATSHKSSAGKARTHARRATTHVASKSTSAPVAAQPVASAPASAGMRIYRDPETGVLGMPPASDQPTDFSGMFGPVSEPVLITHADGSLEMELNGNGQEFAIMTIGKDGRPAFHCVQGPRAGAKTAAPPRAAVKWEER